MQSSPSMNQPSYGNSGFNPQLFDNSQVKERSTLQRDGTNAGGVGGQDKALEELGLDE